MTQQNPAFRTVMRGYESGEVDRVVAELRKALEQARAETADSSISVTKMHSQVAQLEEQLSGYRARLAALEQEQRETAPPSFNDLGARIGKMLKLAQEEAAEMRAKAKSESDKLVADAEAAAEQTRVAADRYSRDVTSKTDAESTRALEGAKRQSDEILDYADREATARRGEAEAVYEHQRARAAAAAADFEKTLAERRDKAAADFAVQMQANELAIARAQERQAALETEADRTLADAHAQAEDTIKAAREQAGQHIDSARMAADKVRHESERELQAATSRRDSITAQLTNVRQMLATLGSASIVNPLGDPEPEAAEEEPQAEVEGEPADVEEAAAEDSEAEPAEVEDETEDLAEQGTKA